MRWNPENATPDSQLHSSCRKQGKIVNESSLFAEEVCDYDLDAADFDEDDIDLGGVGITLMASKQPDDASDSDEGDCQVNVADDVMSLSVISKSINTSYINLKRHNPLKSVKSNSGNKEESELRDICPELIKPTRYH